MDFLLGWMDVDIELGRIHFEGEIDEGMRVLGEERLVEGLKGSLEGRAVDEAIWPISRAQ